MSSNIGKDGLSSKLSFKQAAAGTKRSNNAAKVHQPVVEPSLQPKGMGESLPNRQAHYQRQANMMNGSNSENKSKNSDVREKRAARAFAMVASGNEGIESQRSKGR